MTTPRAFTCSACRTCDHPREAHYNPALARVQAALSEAAGDHDGAAMWRWTASNAERQACS